MRLVSSAESHLLPPGEEANAQPSRHYALESGGRWPETLGRGEPATPASICRLPARWSWTSAVRRRTAFVHHSAEDVALVTSMIAVPADSYDVRPRRLLVVSMFPRH